MNQSANASQQRKPQEAWRWEYRVVHINVSNDAPPVPSTPEEASKKLQGFLSPEFIKQEFPQHYQQEPLQHKHPAAQLQHFLNLLGNDGWELVETSQVGGLLMFFFKRLAAPPPLATKETQTSHRSSDNTKVELRDLNT